MNSDYIGIESLIIKYLKEELTEEESELLSAWRRKSPENESLFAELTDDIQLTREFNVFRTIDQEMGSRRLRTTIREKEPPVYMRRLYWSVAACVLVLIGS